MRFCQILRKIQILRSSFIDVLHNKNMREGFALIVQVMEVAPLQNISNKSGKTVATRSKPTAEKSKVPCRDSSVHANAHTKTMRTPVIFKIMDAKCEVRELHISFPHHKRRLALVKTIGNGIKAEAGTKPVAGQQESVRHTINGGGTNSSQTIESIVPKCRWNHGLKVWTLLYTVINKQPHN